VNINPFSPATYMPSNLMLIDIDRESRHAIADRYYDEASDAALAGNPKRAQWCELWARRIASTADILREARALIDTPEKWTQDAEARDADGNEVLYNDPSATCFCAIGAMSRAADEYSPSRETRILRRAVFGDVWRPIPSWNDAPETSHADVLEAFDRAITLAEQAA
jgi:hypothetical protein